MKFLQILILIIGLAVFTNAQNAAPEETNIKTDVEANENERVITLRGKVVQSKKAVAGIFVRILDENYKEYFAKTDTKGNYEVKLPAGRYRVSASQPIWGSVDCYSVVENFDLKKKKKVKLDLDLIYCGCG